MNNTNLKSTVIVLAFALLPPTFLIGCASTHEDRAEHHHHEKTAFDGKCAYSVANNQLDVPGKPEFKLEHNGVTYFFSSEELMKKFQDHADEYAKKGQRFWVGGRR